VSAGLDTPRRSRGSAGMVGLGDGWVALCMFAGNGRRVRIFR
jgi:hypothetical protein